MSGYKFANKAKKHSAKDIAECFLLGLILGMVLKNACIIIISKNSINNRTYG